MFDEQYIQDLKEYLESNSSFFNRNNAVDSIQDVLYFRMRNPGYIIFYEEFFLCDIYSNEIWIVQLLRKKIYNKIRKQWLSIKPIIKVVGGCQQKFPCFNGYWKIPEIYDSIKTHESNYLHTEA